MPRIVDGEFGRVSQRTIRAGIAALNWDAMLPFCMFFEIVLDIVRELAYYNVDELCVTGTSRGEARAP